MKKQKALKAEAPKTIEVVAGAIGHDGALYSVANEEGEEFRLLADCVEYKAKAKDEFRPICDYLKPVCRTRDASGGSCGLLVEFENGSETRRMHIFYSEFAGGSVVKALMDAGLDVKRLTGNGGLSPVLKYLNAAYNKMPKSEAMLSINHCGWTDGAFTAYRFGNKTIGETDTYLIEGEPANDLSTKGSLDDWNRTIGTWALHSSRWVLAICAALAGPLCQPLGQSNMVFNFCGRSGSGKTKALAGAATVYGGPERIESWESTKGAAAVLSAKYADQALLMDELGQISESAVMDIAYLLGNGKERNRLNPDSSLRKARAWNGFVLSSSEKTLEEVKNQYSRGRKLPVSTGELVRFVSIPADAGRGLRMLESVPKSFLDKAKGDTQEAARLFTDAYGSFPAHGCVGQAFLECLVKEFKDHSPEELKKKVEEIKAAFREIRKLDPDETRVMSGFALCALAGELAIAKGIITAWRPGDATSAAIACFKAWIESGETPQGRVNRTIEALDEFPESHPKLFDLYTYVGETDLGGYPQPEGEQTKNGYVYKQAENFNERVGVCVRGVAERHNLTFFIYRGEQFKNLIRDIAPGMRSGDVLEGLKRLNRLVIKSDEIGRPYIFRVKNSTKPLNFEIKDGERVHVVSGSVNSVDLSRIKAAIFEMEKHD